MKAILRFDPDRREEQLAFVRERVPIVHEVGDIVWVTLTEEQAARFTEQGIQVQPREGADLIQLPAVVFDPEGAVPAPPPALTATMPAGETTAYTLVQFIVAPETEWVQAVEDLGGVFVEDVPVHAAVFAMTAGQITQARALGEFISWVGLFHPAYALSFELAGREEPYSAADLASLSPAAAVFTARLEGSIRVAFFADRDPSEMRVAIQAAGAQVVTDSGYDFIVNVAANRVTELLKVPGVKALEAHRTETLANQRAGIIAGTNQVRSLGAVNFLTNLDGAGEIVGVIDSGLDNGVFPTAATGPLANAHADFCAPGVLTASRILRVPPPPPDPLPNASNNLHNAAFSSQDFAPHGTHVVGSILGDGRAAPLPTPASPNNSVPRGMAPRAQVVFHSANRFGVPPVVPPAFDVGPFLNGFRDAFAMGARVHSNSWGASGPNTYNSTSGRIDRFAFLNPEALVLFAAHNNEADLNNDGNFDQNFLGPQAVPKNILTIGASENVTNADGDSRPYLTAFGFNPPFPNCVRYGTGAANQVRVAATTVGVGAPPTFPISDNANDIAMFSCRGRVANPVPPGRRRVKPDLVAPGTNIMSTLPVGFAQPAQIGQVCPPFVGAAIAVPNPSIPTTAPTGLPAAPPTSGYFVISGTSMATPIAAGCALLTRQFYRQRFGQLRRPLLLETLSVFVDPPAAVAQADGPVLAWIRRDAGSGQSEIRWARFDRELRSAGTAATLSSNVGDHPAIALARHNDNTLALYRDASNSLRLLLRDQTLRVVNTFGAGGTVSLPGVTRSEDNRRPALAVHDDDVALVWFQIGGENVVFQRFNAATGAALDAASVNLGAGTHASPHPYVMHTGVRWAVFWQRVDGADVKVMARFVDNTGKALGAGRVTVLTRNAAILDPHVVFDSRKGRFLLAFASETAAERGIVVQLVNADGSTIGPAIRATALPATASGRRPRLALHPSGGFVLLWEDNSQGTFDVYCSVLDANGALTAVKGLRVSDTPNDTSGFAAAADRFGVTPVWQSNDEINSDMLGVYAVGITSDGVFRAQVDPSTPLLAQQFYVRQTLIEHGEPDLKAVAQAWGGGDHYLLRDVGDGLSDDLYLVRTNADGLPDSALAPDGAVRIVSWVGYDALALAWTGTQLVAATSFGSDSRVYLLDGNGRVVTTFADHGMLLLFEVSTDTIFLQLATSGTGAGLRVFVAYGRFGAAGAHTIRLTVRDRTGTATLAPRDLITAVAGTARHGWFHLVSTDAPVRLIAAWHIQSGANQIARVNRFRPDGTPQTNAPAGPFALTALGGDSINAVIAPRPVVFLPSFPLSPGDPLGSRQREYGAAWQQRAPGGNWQILFSRLDRTGKPSTVAARFDVVVAQSATDHATDPQLVWHIDGYGLAWRQQAAAGGTHQLMFTILDQNGQRPNLAQVGQPAAPATDFVVSDTAADVQCLHLVWTGSLFRLAWTEVEAGRLRHMQRALAVPRVAGSGRYDAPFQQPSAALLKATLINGATNIRNTPLPNFGNNPNDGYGWGRINLRQSLSPLPPVTFHVRDDGSVAAGRTVRYQFTLPPATQLLRITLAWTDPPGNAIVNHIGLRVTTPAFTPGGVRVFHGNRWQTTAGSQHLSAPITVAAPPAFEDTHPVQQVVIAGPPALPAGVYIVEVVGGAFGGSAFQPFPAQPFALVFVGSGPEIRTAAAPGVGPTAIY